MANCIKNRLQITVNSEQKSKKGNDNRSRFERKIDFGGGAFFQICGEGVEFFESSNF